MDEYRERYRGEITQQEKFVLAVLQGAMEIMRAHPDWGPTDCEKAVKALSDAVQKLVPEMMKMRARMPGQQPALENKIELAAAKESVTY